MKGIKNTKQGLTQGGEKLPLSMLKKKTCQTIIECKVDPEKSPFPVSDYLVFPQHFLGRGLKPNPMRRRVGVKKIVFFKPFKKKI